MMDTGTNNPYPAFVSCISYPASHIPHHPKKNILHPTFLFS